MPPNTQPAPLTPHDRRRATAEKLRAALDRLVRGTPERAASQHSAHRLTVAALAREAGVARNAIYTNHRDILDELVQARRRGTVADRLDSTEQKIAEQRAVFDDMQIQIRQLATENAGLLRRAVEAERLAESADRRTAQLTRQIDALRRPVVLRPLNT
jgi:AcrR family transcriptional regulator